jgi:hypothetical protein
MKNDVLESALIGVFESIKGEVQLIDSLDDKVVVSAKGKVKVKDPTPGWFPLIINFEPIEHTVRKGPLREFYILLVDRRTGEVISDSRTKPDYRRTLAQAGNIIVFRPEPIGRGK